MRPKPTINPPATGESEPPTPASEDDDTQPGSGPTVPAVLTRLRGTLRGAVTEGHQDALTQKYQ